MGIEEKAIKKVGSKWCVMHCTGPKKGKPIKCFATEGEAKKMHAAIQARKSKSYLFFTNDIGTSTATIKGKKRYYVTGYISTKDLDIDNEIVTENALNSLLTQLKQRNIKLDVEHEAFRDNPNIIPVGRIVEAFKDEKGVWVKAELNSSSPKFDAVWGSIKDRFIDAFSIAFKTIREIPKQVGSKMIKLIDDLQILNVALTGNPVNTACQITDTFMKDVFLKSLNDFEGVEDYNDTEEEKAKDDRPPKEWWDKCIRGVSKAPGVRDADKLCGWMWEQPGHHGLKSRDFDEDISNLKKLTEVVSMGTKDEPIEEEEPKKEPEETEEPSTEEPKPEEKKEEAPAETESTDDTESAETKTKALEKRVEELTKELKSVKETIEKPMLKAKVESQPDEEKLKGKEQFNGPLDLIGR